MKRHDTHILMVAMLQMVNKECRVMCRSALAVVAEQHRIYFWQHSTFSHSCLEEAIHTQCIQSLWRSTTAAQMAPYSLIFYLHFIKDIYLCRGIMKLLIVARQQERVVPNFIGVQRGEVFTFSGSNHEKCRKSDLQPSLCERRLWLPYIFQCKLRPFCSRRVAATTTATTRVDNSKYMYWKGPSFLDI